MNNRLVSTEKQKIENSIMIATIVIAVICAILSLLFYRYINEKRAMQYYNLKKVTWYGDSLTQMYFYCSEVDNYFHFIGHNSGMNGTLITNVNTSSMSNKVRMHFEEEVPAEEDRNIAVDSDIIFVMGGVNDWNHNAPIGDVEESFANVQKGILDGDTFAGACNMMFYNLKDMYPDARIIVLGTPFVSGKGYGLFKENDGALNDYGLTSVDYGDVLCNVADMWGIDNINIGRCLDWNSENIFNYCSDGMHFDEKTGATVVGKEIIKFLKKCYRK